MISVGNLDIFGDDPKADARIQPQNASSETPSNSVDASPRKSRKSNGTPKRFRALKSAGVLVVVIALIALAVPKAISMFSGAPDFPGPGTSSVRVEVKDGDTLARIGNTLKASGVVKSVDAFVAAANNNPNSAKISAGFYDLKLQMSAKGAVNSLLDPTVKVVDRVVIPEGKRAAWIYATLAKASGLPVTDFETAAANATQLGLPGYANGNVEGFLFPATYELAPGATAVEILKMMIAKFNAESTSLNLEARAKSMGRTPYDILSIASLLQVEGHPRDFSKVARVVYNRLAAPMRLQFDSTVNYGLGRTDVILTTDILNKDTTYNMYLHDGLPPTPIDNPGAAAIEAALNPAAGDWLYFITTDLKTQETKFTKSYAEFLRFKDEFLAFCAANPGSC